MPAQCDQSHGRCTSARSPSVSRPARRHRSQVPRLTSLLRAFAAHGPAAPSADEQFVRRQQLLQDKRRARQAAQPSGLGRTGLASQLFGAWEQTPKAAKEEYERCEPIQRRPLGCCCARSAAQRRARRRCLPLRLRTARAGGQPQRLTGEPPLQLTRPPAPACPPAARRYLQAVAALLGGELPSAELQEAAAAAWGVLAAMPPPDKARGRGNTLLLQPHRCGAGRAGCGAHSGGRRAAQG